MSIIHRIEEASKAYYEGNPIMSDAEFDTLVAQAKNLDGYDENVGFGYAPDSRKVSLKSPMLSLNKVSNNFDQLDAWMRSIQKEFPEAVFYIEPKWDGLSIQTVFENGKITFAATRGNGQIGEDVLDMASNISELTDYCRSYDGIMNGEVIMTYEALRQLNADTNGDYKNTRNAAAGLLRRLGDTHLAKYLSFRPHDSGFGEATSDRNNIVEQVRSMTNGRSGFPSAIDGVVIKVADRDGIRDALGFTRSAPRWAIAFKFENRSEDTTLRSIRWTVGRTGRLIPSAIFDAVNFDNETTVATLHNVEWMSELNLHVGDTVNIESAGDVIPYFNGVVERNESGEQLGLPESCPLCFGPVTRDGVHLVCVVNCNVEAKLIYFFRAFDTKGIGPGLIAALFEYAVLPNETTLLSIIERVIKLDPSLIAELPGCGESKAATYASEIEKIKTDSILESWLVGLGIPGFAWANAEVLVGAYPSLDAIIQVIEESPESLWSLNGFGGSIISTLEAHLDDFKQLREVLNNLGITPQVVELIEIQHDENWTDKNIVLTGTLPEGISRGVASDWLAARGANIQGGINGKTDILVAGEKAGSKLAKAEQLGVRIINGEEFLEFYKA